MSIMYRALRKLKQSDAAAVGVDKGKLHGGRSLDENDGEVPFAVKIALGAIPVVVLGLGAGYWYTHPGSLEDLLGKGADSSAIAAKNVAGTPSRMVPVAPASVASPPAAMASAATPPAMAAASVATSSITASSLGANLVDSAQGANTFKGVPQTPNTMMVADAAKAIGAVAARENPPQADSSITAADASRLEQILGGLGDDQLTNKGVDSQNTVSAAAGSQGKTRTLAETGKEPAGGKKATEEPGIPGEEKASGETGSAGDGKGASSSGDAQNYVQSGEIKKKTLETSRTVSKLKNALAVGNNEDVDAGLSRLTASKGENNPFVMKMQAFLYMREGKYDQAGALLEEVLRNRKNDLDAAKNMVIVEMKTNRVPLAQERLKDLLRRHPNDRQLRDLRQYLN